MGAFLDANKKKRKMPAWGICQACLHGAEQMAKNGLRVGQERLKSFRNEWSRKDFLVRALGTPSPVAIKKCAERP